MSVTDWYLIKNMEEVDSPALVVYTERVESNIRLALQMTGGPERFRPHVKTHKSPQAAQLLLAAGVRQFKCATIAEAEMLAMAGAPDVLLAYQPIGPKVQRFIKLIGKYPGTVFSCLVDNALAADAMSAAFAGAGQRVPVYLDLNVGMGRTGILPVEAKELYAHCRELKGIRPVGLHAYDGHLRDRDYAERKQKCDAAFAPVLALKEAIAKEYPGDKPLVIVAGGSPSFSVHSKREGVVCSPGTFIYWDKGYCDNLPEQAFAPAALVVTRVVSLPGEGRVCLDLGHKSIAAENELGRRVYFLNAPELQFVSQSEEHLVVDAGKDHGWQPGDVLYGIPMHVCPTVALYERALTVREGLVDGQWENRARDRKLTV